MVRHYCIYLIEEEFASHYFGRESKMYHLFQDYQWTRSQTKHFNLIQKQVSYITKPIPTLFIHQLIATHLAKRTDYQQTHEIHKIELKANRGSATLIVKDRHLELTSNGSYEAETIFFEVLRKFDPCFLAMDFLAERYGWLNPIKERNFV
ncbi:sporulation inhibitor of replication protein SirA [Metabacillus herbersteinensis]|uniref:Sporulation inhibitor of replication protein SirA n=1 Tax=Metabacillus herbersteinensis TaxID=283816 RepID=A0ABV6GCP7_9BACI